MFAESIHSLADTINQLILAYGIHKSVQVSYYLIICKVYKRKCAVLLEQNISTTKY